MTAVRLAHPIIALHSRALERAVEYAAHGGSFLEATRPIWDFAHEAGLVAYLGPETVEAIIYGAFCLPASSKWRH
jgi:hypothetical protein